MIELNQVLTTTRPLAAEQLQQGIDGFNRWRADALRAIDAAIGSDPDFAMAYTVKGIILLGARATQFLPLITECLTRAETRQQELNEREQGYLRAFRALAEGKNHQAVLEFELVLERYPTDLFAHRAVQQELFWLGEVRWMRDIALRALPAWSPEAPDYGAFLAVCAFAHEETGDYEIAENMGREAIARDACDCWAAHAVSHVLEMQNRHREGVAWLEALCDNWAEANQIAHHLWWHLCLFTLEQQDHERILTLLDNKVRNPESPLVKALPDAYIDLQNAASLLLRLELRGVAVGERWQPLAQAALPRIGNHLSPFTCAHVAAIMAGAGRFDEAGRLVQSLETAAKNVERSLSTRIQQSALPAAKAAIAHRRQDYAGVIDQLMPARRELWRMGGSHAQRDIFYQLLVDACYRLGRKDYLAILFDEMHRSIGFSEITERTFYRDVA